MKNKILSILFAGIALIGVSSAFAYEEDNWYVSGAGSFGFYNDSKVITGQGKNSTSYKSDQKNGFGGSIAVGRSFDCWRVELEAAHRQTSTKKLTDKQLEKLGFDPKAGESFRANYKGQTSLMVNAYRDIPVSEEVSLYVGAGAGIALAHTSTDAQEISATTGKLEKFHKNKTSVVPAGQVMAGLTYHVNDRVDLYGGYRLIVTGKPKFHNLNGERIKMKSTPFSNNIELGLRFKF